MKIILPIAPPPVTSHHFYALPLSIICTGKTAVNWMYSEFIQLFTFRDKEGEYSAIHFYNHKNDMFTYEPLDDIRIQPKLLINGDNIIDVYKYFLDSGQYIYDFIDKYYISSMKISWHFIHDLLVYGYDDNKKIFNAFAYNGLKLTEFEIPYNEYSAAYNSEYKVNKYHLTVLYRLKDGEYKIDEKKIKWYLLDYIESVNTYNRESLLDVKLYKPRFGFDIYDELLYMFNFQRNLKVQIRMPDLYCLYEHKKLMAERSRYLNQNSDILCTDELLNEFKDIESEAQKIVLFAMKVNQRNFDKKSDFDNLTAQVNIVRDKEKSAYEKYFDYNRNTFNNI